MSEFTPGVFSFCQCKKCCPRLVQSRLTLPRINEEDPRVYTGETFTSTIRWTICDRCLLLVEYIPEVPYLLKKDRW